jgi:L-alanine-DL-glutamate epimerase-like enolase superfamily enzyme
MKITRVEPILVRTPMQLGGTAPMASGRPKTDVHTLLVRVDTDEGLSGWGEAFGLAGWMSTRAAIEHVVAPRCIGQDASAISQLMYDLQRGLYNTGRSGPVMFAMSAVDIALWDIAGKASGLPLHRLLGGSARTALPAYASLLRYGDAEVVRRQVAQALERGYRLIKLHENRSEIIRAARAAAGESVPLMVDCSCPWTVDEAIAASRELQDVRLTWLEEPIYPPDDHAGLARVRAASPIPIAAGENVSNVIEFKRLLELGALSYAQPSITKIGGVTEMRKVFALADSFGVTVVPHSPYFGPGLLASIHVCAAAPRETWIERYYCDFAETPFGDSIMPRDGMFAVPQDPGLGRDPDMNVVDRMRVA